jgi:hypothetical protein
MFDIYMVYLLILYFRALVECIGLFISGEHGFPDLPDYPAGNIW